MPRCRAREARKDGVDEGLAIMFAYPARIRKHRNGYVVRFRDIPEALTSGASRDEAIEMACDALATAMQFYFEDRREVPMPSQAAKGEVLVWLPTRQAMQVRQRLRSPGRPPQPG